MSKSPFKILPAVGLAIGAAGAIGQTVASFMGQGDRIREQKAAEAENRKMMQEYRDLDTSNIYANVRNPYENIETEFENVYEDLTVNQQQAQFEKQMAQQQQANIMQNLQGAAGGSGIAGLAQAMANQGQLQAQRAGASIGMQESQNQRLAAQGAMQIDQMRRKGAMQVDQIRRKGELDVDLVRRQGQQMVQEAEMRRQSTLLGMAFQGAAGAASGLQSAYANQMSAGATAAQMGSNMAGSAFGMLGQTAGLEGGLI